MAIMKFGLYCFSFLAFVSAAHSLTAAPLQDALGDFLPVYVGPQNGDLDVTEVNAFLIAPNKVEIMGTHAAPIGTTAGSIYVWGIDRGAGIEPFPAIIRRPAKAFSSMPQWFFFRTAQAFTPMSFRAARLNHSIPQRSVFPAQRLA